MERGRRIKEEITGVVAILGGLIAGISLISHHPDDPSAFTFSSTYELKNLLGAFGSHTSDVLMSFAGYSSYILPLILFVYGTRKIFGKTTGQRVSAYIAMILLLVLATSSFLELAFCDHVSDVHLGGVIGLYSANFALKTVSMIGSYILFLALALIALMYIAQLSIADISKRLKARFTLTGMAIAAMRARKKEKKQRRIQMEESMTGEAELEQGDLPLSYPEIRTHEVKTVIPKKSAAKSPVKNDSGEYELPGPDLLKDPPPSVSKPSKEELIDRSDLLEGKLQDYSIEGKVTYVSPGPIVTMFEYEPAPGIKINKVMTLADDLAMALKASSIRISPIHGRSTLGIEVPNKEREVVFLKDLVTSESFKSSHSRLTLALGKDIFGIPVMEDLSKMPHLLIAGATGSGKSVGLNSIILNILYKASPKEVKMLMIDPKMLELSAYEEIPHLLMPVITLPKEASQALKKLVFEMERRYRMLAETGARNIDTYNRKILADAAKKKSAGEPADKEPLPYIVIIIDELADLMFATKHDVEDSIARLAQMARAAGIHLILATQRPSVDVITGIIKANFPSRLSFQVSSKLDSRIILDTYGADQLLGHGDMLFVSPGKKIKRIHGSYVSEEEIRSVVNFIKSQAGPDYTLFEDLPFDAEELFPEADKDDLYAQAKSHVLSTGQASISFIQRRMKIGYNRAARMMEMMEEEGIVGPPVEAGKPREILWRKK